MTRPKKQNLFDIIAEQEAKQSPTYTKLVGDYRVFSKKCAEGFIKRAETVYVAKQELKDGFSAFCREVDLDENGATCRKWTTVGSVASRFEPFLDKLPDCWTTIYTLATLENDQFDRVTQDRRFGPKMTGPDVDLIVGKPRQVTTQHKADVISIDLSGLNDGPKIEVYQAVTALEQQFGFAFKAPEGLVSLANNQRRAA